MSETDAERHDDAQAYTAVEIAEFWETHAMDNHDCATCRWLATISDLGSPSGADRMNEGDGWLTNGAEVLTVVHTHEWLPAGLVAEDIVSSSPVSVMDDIVQTAQIAIRSCACGALDRAIVSVGSRRWLNRGR